MCEGRGLLLGRPQHSTERGRRRGKEREEERRGKEREEERGGEGRRRRRGEERGGGEGMWRDIRLHANDWLLAG